VSVDADDRVEVVDRPEQRRYELLVGGEVAGFARYVRREPLITFIHTVVEPAYGGRGLGQRLAQAVLDDARARGLRVRPRCPFIARYIREHPAEQDLVDPGSPSG